MLVRVAFYPKQSLPTHPLFAQCYTFTQGGGGGEQASLSDDPSRAQGLFWRVSFNTSLFFLARFAPCSACAVDGGRSTSIKTAIFSFPSSFFFFFFFFFDASWSSLGGFSAHFAQCSYAPGPPSKLLPLSHFARKSKRSWSWARKERHRSLLAWARCQL